MNAKILMSSLRTVCQFFGRTSSVPTWVLLAKTDLRGEGTRNPQPRQLRAEIKVRRDEIEKRAPSTRLR